MLCSKSNLCAVLIEHDLVVGEDGVYDAACALLLLIFISLDMTTFFAKPFYGFSEVKLPRPQL